VEPLGEIMHIVGNIDPQGRRKHIFPRRIFDVPLTAVREE
jgi:hypothetical protein